jgi:hypothetical protein
MPLSEIPKGGEVATKLTAEAPPHGMKNRFEPALPPAEVVTLRDVNFPVA